LLPGVEAVVVTMALGVVQVAFFKDMPVLHRELLIL